MRTQKKCFELVVVYNNAKSERREAGGEIDFGKNCLRRGDLAC